MAEGGSQGSEALGFNPASTAITSPFTQDHMVTVSGLVSRDMGAGARVPTPDSLTLCEPTDP